MQAALIESFGTPPSVRKVPDPEIPVDGVVLRVEATGVCRSDWHAWMGHDSSIRLPHVPGHELVGRVVGVGSGVRRFRRGVRVVVPFCGGCGVCPPCRQGAQNICDDDYQPGFTGWGSFATLVAIPRADANLIPLPESFDPVSAAGLGCRFMTAFRAVVDVARIGAGEWIAVHGCGGVGLSAVQIARARGARVVAVDVRNEALTRAGELGAEVTVNAGETNPVEAVREATGGGVAASLDALGSAETCLNSVLGLAKRGRHVQIGLLPSNQGEVPVPMGRVLSYELEVLGSHGLQAHRYPAMFAFIESAGIDLGALVGRRIPLEEAGAELDGMSRFTQVGMTVIDRIPE